MQPCASERAFPRAQLADLRCAPRGQDPDPLTDRDRPRFDPAHVAARLPRRRPRDILHGKPERRGRERSRQLGRLQDLQQRRTVVPAQAVAAVDHHVAFERRHRNEADIGDAAPRGEDEEIVDDRFERLDAIADEVHLVHGDDEMRNAEKVRERCMPSRLGHDAMPRIDQQNGEVCRAGRRDHVARVLFVARRVGDDELAQGRREIAVGDINRDALFALGDEAVGQERQVQGLAAALRRALDRGKLVGENRLGVVQQPADQRALAIIDTARGKKPQHAVVERIEAFERRHQKYPSRLRSSIDASCV